MPQKCGKDHHVSWETIAWVRFISIVFIQLIGVVFDWSEQVVFNILGGRRRCGAGYKVIIFSRNKEMYNRTVWLWDRWGIIMMTSRWPLWHGRYRDAIRTLSMADLWHHSASSLHHRIICTKHCKRYTHTKKKTELYFYWVQNVIYFFWKRTNTKIALTKRVGKCCSKYISVWVFI